MDQIKTTFIQRAVARYCDDVIRRMSKVIDGKKIIDTSELKHSLSSSVNSNSAGATGKLIFNEYGRFVDMGVGRSHPLGGSIRALQDTIIASNGAKRSLGRKEARKPRKFYSPIAYGKLNGLIGDIAYGFTDEAANAIKRELESHQAQ